jgi:hypothetical protein
MNVTESVKSLMERDGLRWDLVKVSQSQMSYLVHTFRGTDEFSIFNITIMVYECYCVSAQFKKMVVIALFSTSDLVQ